MRWGPMTPDTFSAPQLALRTAFGSTLRHGSEALLLESALGSRSGKQICEVILGDRHRHGFPYTVTLL